MRVKRATAENPVVIREGTPAYYYFLEHGNLYDYKPQKQDKTNPTANEGSADHIHDDLALYDIEHKHDLGDSKLAETLGSALTKKLNHLKSIEVNKDSSLYPWLSQINSAFDNKQLNKWCEEHNIDKNSLSFSSGGWFSARDKNDNYYGFPSGEFAKRYPTVANALTPLAQLAEVLDPKSEGLGLKPNTSEQGQTTIALVLSFYGLTKKSGYLLDKQLGSDLMKNAEFPEGYIRPPASDNEFARQKNVLQAVNWGYRLDVESPANSLQNDLDHYAEQIKYEKGDNKLSQIIAEKMATLQEDDLTKPSPMIPVPAGSALRRWTDLRDSAFNNQPLQEWSVKYAARDFRYDPSTEKFYATVGGEAKNFTPSEFTSQYPDYADALNPLIEVSKVLAPSASGIELTPAQFGHAPLDVVLNFYGLDPANKDLSNIHKIAQDLKNNQKFFEQPYTNIHNDQAYEKQMDNLEAVNNKFRIWYEAENARKIPGLVPEYTAPKKRS